MKTINYRSVMSLRKPVKNEVNHLKSLPIFVLFLVFAVILRWSTFYQSSIDWDESLYLLVADAWRQGNPPYTVIWDNKPPGIYIIFLTALSLYRSVFTIRILACMFIAISCFTRYKIGSLIETHGKQIGLASGVLYAILTLNNGGLAANTEIFFAPFVLLGFYAFFGIVFHSEEHKSILAPRLILVGFLLGLGFVIKYVVLFDLATVSLLLLYTLKTQARSPQYLRQLLTSFFFLILGFAIPFAATLLYFSIHGSHEEFIYANFVANKLRTIQINFSLVSVLKSFYWQFKIESLFWLAIPITCVIILFPRTLAFRERFIASTFVLSFVCVLLGIASVFRVSFNNHYFLQAAPALCFATAYVCARFPNFVMTSHGIYRLRYLVIFSVLTIMILSTNFVIALKAGAEYIYHRHIKLDRYWNDVPASISAYLAPRLDVKDHIFVVSDFPIIYFLAKAKIPTRYAFPAFLVIQQDLPNITGIDPVKELDLILQKKPVYIVQRNNYQGSKLLLDNKLFFDRLLYSLAKEYSLETKIGGYSLYRLKADS
jgi:hypothetical protein